MSASADTSKESLSVAPGIEAELGRRAAHVSLDDSRGVADLLLFYLFCQQEDRAEQFRFGRQADSRPATRWAWTDLG